MNSVDFTALLALTTAASFTPGPNTTLSTALAANLGLRRALRFVLAVPVGWGLLFSLCARGVGALVVALPALRIGIQATGVAYLLWLAARLARSASLAQADASQLKVTFWQGVLLQFLNIKAWMLALAIVSGWVAGRADSTQRLAIVVPTMLCFAFTSNILYAAMGSLLRDWLCGPEGTGQRLRMFNQAMALVLVATAIWMATL